MNWLRNQYRTPATPVLHFLLFFTAWIYSGMHVMSSPALKYLPPYVFAVIRLSIGMPLIYLISLKEKRVQLTWRESGKLVAIGICGIGIPQSLVFQTNKLVGAGILGMMIPLATIFTVALSGILGLERITPFKGIGVTLAVTGSVAIAWVSEGDFHTDTVWGVGLMFFQSAAWSIYLIMMSKFLKAKPIPLYAYFRAVVWGYLFMLPLGAFQVADVKWSEIPHWVWLVEMYCGIFVSAGAHVTMSWLIKHCASFLPALYICVQPLATVILAMLALGERFSPWLFLCMFSILAGLLLVITGKVMEQKESRVAGGNSVKSESVLAFADENTGEEEPLLISTHDPDVQDDEVDV